MLWFGLLFEEQVGQAFSLFNPYIIWPLVCWQNSPRTPQEERERGIEGERESEMERERERERGRERVDFGAR